MNKNGHTLILPTKINQRDSPPGEKKVTGKIYLDVFKKDSYLPFLNVLVHKNGMYVFEIYTDKI